MNTFKHTDNSLFEELRRILIEAPETYGFTDEAITRALRTISEEIGEKLLLYKNEWEENVVSVRQKLENILATLNIRLSYGSIPDSINGFLFTDKHDNKLIFINDNPEKESIRLSTIAHELGHLLMSHQSVRGFGLINELSNKEKALYNSQEQDADIMSRVLLLSLEKAPLLMEIVKQNSSSVSTTSILLEKRMKPLHTVIINSV